MKPLGHSLTWKDECFFGCGRIVFAHTNGSGDFVLLEKLGWPWEVHACYAAAFGSADSTSFDVGGSKVFGWNGQAFKPWDAVRAVTPETLPKKRRYEVLGTVTEVIPGAFSKVPGFSELANHQKAEMRKSLQGRTSLVRLVSGSGEEFAVLFDRARHRLQFQDIVGVTLSTREFPMGRFFALTQIRICWRGGAPC